MITIVTPTYNRGYTLLRLYESLCQQTVQSFEWLVIDDGSTDNTFELIVSCKKKANFKIHVHYQENSGKHSAINAGVKHAIGDWIIIVDSDDILTYDAIDKIYKCINHIDSNFIGMCFRKATLSGQVIGTSNVEFNTQMIMDPITAGYIFQGDLAYVFRTMAMRTCPFPVFKNEKFVPELYIWNKISDIGKIVFYADQIIYLCEYLPDGYTNNFKMNFKNNPHGFGLFYRDQIIRDKRLTGKIKAFTRSLQCIWYSWLQK